MKVIPAVGADTGHEVDVRIQDASLSGNQEQFMTPLTAPNQGSYQFAAKKMA